MQTVKDITQDVIKPFDKAGDVLDNLDKTFILHSIKTGESEFGEWVIVMVSETPDSEEGAMFVRGSKVKERLHYIDQQKLFPCTGKFIKNGRTYELE